jgi:hypothetical protein
MQPIDLTCRIDRSPDHLDGRSYLLLRHMAFERAFYFGEQTPVQSEFGRKIAVDLKPEADFNERWGCPRTRYGRGRDQSA